MGDRNEPPEGTREPFLARRTPQPGALTLPLRARPQPPPMPCPVPQAAAGGEALPTASPPAELVALLDGLRGELVYFRSWLPEQLARLEAATPARPALPPEELPPWAPARQRRAWALALGLMVGTAIGVSLALAGGELLEAILRRLR